MEKEQEREKTATKAYCEAHQKQGLEVCSWSDMPGYDMFLKGELTESELSEQAKEELAQLTRTFGRFLKVDAESKSRAAGESALKEEKAKAANKIYKRACVESGKSFCFFKNFSAWQDFVHGRIGEAELFERAAEEIRLKAEQEG